MLIPPLPSFPTVPQISAHLLNGYSTFYLLGGYNLSGARVDLLKKNSCQTVKETGSQGGEKGIGRHCVSLQQNAVFASDIHDYSQEKDLFMFSVGMLANPSLWTTLRTQRRTINPELVKRAMWFKGDEWSDYARYTR
ncbi:hypothetical protein ARMGADRAFT_1031186 [Armillaria gallica]|uniref:Uncharacterized protein n=1 Tax=Armillaria gallica TaxID=47427 RepID=A0A2H3DAP7_ARMGA|nr:hypothetical protein ARMGADRAFT_1031186 [Armillaria gallica]